MKMDLKKVGINPDEDVIIVGTCCSVHSQSPCLWSTRGFCSTSPTCFHFAFLPTAALKEHQDYDAAFQSVVDDLSKVSTFAAWQGAAVKFLCLNLPVMCN